MITNNRQRSVLEQIVKTETESETPLYPLHPDPEQRSEQLQKIKEIQEGKSEIPLETEE